MNFNQAHFLDQLSDRLRDVSYNEFKPKSFQFYDSSSVTENEIQNFLVRNVNYIEDDAQKLIIILSEFFEEPFVFKTTKNPVTSVQKTFKKEIKSDYSVVLEEDNIDLYKQKVNKIVKTAREDAFLLLKKLCEDFSNGEYYKGIVPLPYALFNNHLGEEKFGSIMYEYKEGSLKLKISARTNELNEHIELMRKELRSYREASNFLIAYILKKINNEPESIFQKLLFKKDLADDAKDVFPNIPKIAELSAIKDLASNPAVQLSIGSLGGILAIISFFAKIHESKKNKIKKEDIERQIAELEKINAAVEEISRFLDSL